MNYIIFSLTPFQSRRKQINIRCENKTNTHKILEIQRKCTVKFNMQLDDRDIDYITVGIMHKINSS